MVGQDWRAPGATGGRGGGDKAGPGPLHTLAALALALAVAAPLAGSASAASPASKAERPLLAANDRVQVGIDLRVWVAKGRDTGNRAGIWRTRAMLGSRDRKEASAPWFRLQPRPPSLPPHEGA